MSDSSFEQKVLKVFAEKLDIEIPSNDTDLVETGVLDSMTFVDLLMNLEQEFSVTISMEELEIDRFRTVSKIAEFVSQQNGSSSSL